VRKGFELEGVTPASWLRTTRAIVTTVASAMAVGGTTSPRTARATVAIVVGEHTKCHLPVAVV
jgi:hypothetical protein